MQLTNHKNLIYQAIILLFCHENFADCHKWITIDKNFFVIGNPGFYVNTWRKIRQSITEKDLSNGVAEVIGQVCCAQMFNKL